MSVNLLDMASTAMVGNFHGALGSFLGESQSTASAGLSAVLPALIGGLVSKGNTADGASSLLSLLNTPQVDAGIAGTLGNLFAHGSTQASGLVTLGSSLLCSLFGDKTSAMAGAIAAVSGIKSPTATSLLSLAVPIVLGLIKSHVSQNNLGASGLMTLLRGQGEHLSGKIDPRVSAALGIPSVAGLPGLGGAGLHGAAATAGSGAAAAGATAGGGSVLMKWLPWIVGVAVILWALGGMRACTPAGKAVLAPAVSPAADGGSGSCPWSCSGSATPVTPLFIVAVYSPPHHGHRP